MFSNKNKICYLIIFVFIISISFPIYSMASNDTAFVWSETSNPTIETATSLAEDKR